VKSPDGTAVVQAGSFNFPSMLIAVVVRLARIVRTVDVDVGGG
jgi:hypothetical protein